MTSVADIGSFQRFTSAMPQKLKKAADAGKHGNLKIHAVAGQAVCRTPAVGAAFSTNFRSRHPFPSKSKRPVKLAGLFIAVAAAGRSH
ncbi:hypothetical protein [Rhizobium sp. RCAM05973]|uniref:hypothetical protein n=1 Tax=Rhizobium sp. RCAM05973 TaxID=2994066 RepID=UPI0012D329C2|nr:hypothetical protein [Rhizobium sp. RCAM05973]